MYIMAFIKSRASDPFCINDHQKPDHLKASCSLNCHHIEIALFVLIHLSVLRKLCSSEYNFGNFIDQSYLHSAELEDGHSQRT